MEKKAGGYHFEALFQLIFNNSDDWVVILNSSFRIKKANHAFANEFNLSVDESPGLLIKDVLKRFSLDFQIDISLLSKEKTQIIRTQTKQGHSFSWIIHQTRTDDKELNYLLIGKFPSYKEVFNKYLQLEAILEHMPCNVYWMDKELTHLGCNQNVLKMCGVTKSQYVGSTYEDISKWANWPEGLADSFKGDDSVVLKTGIPKLNVLENPFITAEENLVYLLTSRVPLKDANGDIIGVGGISTDITELVKSKENAEVANKSKTEFLANMSHDVKTPLQGVVGMAQLLAFNDELAPSIREQAETIYACGLQIVNFFDSCLELSKMEMSEWAMKTQTFSIRKLLNNIFSLFLPTAEKKQLSLTIDCDASVPDELEGHYDSIYRVLLNLIGNALKFTERGGVSVHAFLSEEKIDKKANIVFSIEDTGMGIPEDKYRVIFEKLSRLSPSYKGAVEGHGIGLYIVDQYVKRMGGNIKVESTLEKGSKFSITLPLSMSDLVDNSSMESSLLQQNVVLSKRGNSYTPKNNTQVEKVSVSQSVMERCEKSEAKEKLPHILLVEDNPMVQHINSRLLEHAGFSVTVAGTGKEAIEKFSQEKYQLIYMDIGLPDTTGYDVSRTIRKQDKDIPIVALTGHGALDVKKECDGAGIQAVVSKPLTAERIKAIWQEYKPKSVEENQVIDKEGMLELLSSQQTVENLLFQWKSVLKQHLFVLESSIQEKNIKKLREELHSMIGALCYIKMPALYKAVELLQKSARQGEDLSVAYENVLKEADRVQKILYSA